MKEGDEGYIAHDHNKSEYLEFFSYYWLDEVIAYYKQSLKKKSFKKRDNTTADHLSQYL